jgi:hypothetical protein
MEVLAIPDADRAEFELTMPVEALTHTLKRAREDARAGFADGLRRTPTEPTRSAECVSRSPSRPVTGFWPASVTKRRHQHEHQKGPLAPNRRRAKPRRPLRPIAPPNTRNVFAPVSWTGSSSPTCASTKESCR